MTDIIQAESKSISIVDLKNELMPQGYFNLIQTQHYGVIGIMRFTFTFGLMIDLDLNDYDRRYCYRSLEELMFGYQVLLAQDTLSNVPEHPLDPYWIKCKGYGRKDECNRNNPRLSLLDFT